MKQRQQPEKLKSQPAKVSALKEMIKQQSILNSIVKVSTLVEKQKK